MQTQEATTTTGGGIWGRVLQPSSGPFPQATAREILALGFTDDDKARRHDLAQKNGEGKLTPSEKEELETYKVHPRMKLAGASGARSSWIRCPAG